jgi:hypothetical protein
MPRTADQPLILDTVDRPDAKCAGYVVVATCSKRLTGATYEAFDNINEAADCYADYENGEYRDVRPVGIFPCDANGMPSGERLAPAYIARLMRETRAA